MNSDWDAARYFREKRGFVASRLALRAVHLHAGLMFAATWLAGWFMSWLLLRLGLHSMPVRYALAFAFSYLVFMLCVRIWADTLRAERGAGGGDGFGGLDTGPVDAEGCAVVLAALALGMLAAGIFAATGGLPLLLEAAFEVAFAGVVVRRASRRQVLGSWAAVLVRNTWLHALGAALVLVIVAAVLQAKAPQARTFAQAVGILYSATPGPSTGR